MYVGKDGKKKGDALVSFTAPEAVPVCCVKLNNMNIGDGYVISVVRADFSDSKKESEKDIKNTTNGDVYSNSNSKDSNEEGSCSGSDVETIFRRILPKETGKRHEHFDMLIYPLLFPLQPCN